MCCRKETFWRCRSARSGRPSGDRGPQGPAGPPGRGIEITLADYLKQDFDEDRINEELGIGLASSPIAANFGLSLLRQVCRNHNPLYPRHDLIAMQHLGAYVQRLQHNQVSSSTLRRRRRTFSRQGTFSMKMATSLIALRYAWRPIGALMRSWCISRAGDGYLSDRPGTDLASLRFACSDCRPLSITPSQDVLTQRFESWYYPADQEIVAITYRSLEEGLQVFAGKSVESYLGDELSDSTIKHDIYLRPGASGSPLMNRSGYVVGVNLSYADSGEANARYLDVKDKLILNILQRAIDGN